MKDDGAAAASLHQLRYFATVVEEQSFTRAAQRLGISQPALSRQIALLERHLGARLLERAPAGVLPTVTGRAILPEVRAAIASAQRVTRRAREVGGLEAGVLEVATFPSLATGTLLPAIRRWYERHPTILLRLSEFRHRRAMQDALRVGTADVAIGVAPVDWKGPQRRVGWNEAVVVLPPRDPLCERPGGIKLERLADRHWVLYDAAYGLSDVVTAACLNAGFRPNGAIETSQAEAAARLAAAGLGPALVPVANLPPELAGFARRLAPPVVWEIVAYTRTAWSATALAFLDIVAEENPAEPPAGAMRWQVPRA
jgi:DNA-binding transcriptional LysR family regulator